ncbi:MAG: methyl-accepting chemotaxis protein [bacterium]
MNLRKRLLVAGIALTAGPLLTVVAIVAHQETRMAEAASKSCTELATADLDHIALSVQNLCASHADMSAEDGYQLLRQAIMDIKVGQTGYVYVLDGKGNYVVSLGGKRDGENIWGAKDADGTLFIQEIVRKGKTLGSGQVAEQTYPWKNQGEDSSRLKIARIAYYEPWDWVIGASSYLDEFYEAERAISGMGHRNRNLMGVLSLVAILGSGAFWWFLSGRISRRITGVATTLEKASRTVASASQEIASSSQQLASGASEQAASLEEVSASLREIESMTRSNAENARKSDNLAGKAKSVAEDSLGAMTRMSSAIEEIKSASDETARILKSIDEIAFQTNLLALNAAVEAARAGDAGKGFAVVAEEVRNLAQRSADAARNTAQLIDDSQAKAGNGVTVAREVDGYLHEIADGIGQVTELVSQVAQATDEQALGLGEITQAVDQLDQVTQSNAAAAEESAATSGALQQQAEHVYRAVGALSSIVGNGVALQPARTASERAKRPRASVSAPALGSRRPVRTPPRKADPVESLDERELIEI